MLPGSPSPLAVRHAGSTYPEQLTVTPQQDAWLRAMTEAEDRASVVGMEGEARTATARKLLANAMDAWDTFQEKGGLHAGLGMK